MKYIMGNKSATKFINNEDGIRIVEDVYFATLLDNLKYEPSYIRVDAENSYLSSLKVLSNLDLLRTTTSRLASFKEHVDRQKEILDFVNNAVIFTARFNLNLLEDALISKNSSALEKEKGKLCQ
jgi:hypothetical protein